MSSVTANDLAQLGEICSKICYHLTAFIKDVADGKPAASTSDVSKLYQLATALPAPTEAQWAELAGHAPPRPTKKAATPAGTPSAPLAEGAERAPGKRLKWTQQLEEELIQLVEDEEFRKEKLGGWGWMGGAGGLELGGNGMLTLGASGRPSRHLGAGLAWGLRACSGAQERCQGCVSRPARAAAHAAPTRPAVGCWRHQHWLHAE